MEPGTEGTKRPSLPWQSLIPLPTSSVLSGHWPLSALHLLAAQVSENTGTPGQRQGCPAVCSEYSSSFHTGLWQARVCDQDQERDSGMQMGVGEEGGRQRARARGAAPGTSTHLLHRAKLFNGEWHITNTNSLPG